MIECEAYGNHLIVKTLNLGNETKSGILLGDSFGKGVLTAVEVVSIGNTVEDKSLRKGDTLVVTKTGMLNIDYMTDGNTEYAVIEPRSIMAVVVPTKAN